MGNQNLYLVGTHHLDLDGEERLTTLLDRLSPSVVALEFHKDRESLVSSKRSYEEMRKDINERIDEAGLDLSPKQRATIVELDYLDDNVSGYELRVSKDYLQRHPFSRLEYIDLSILEVCQYFVEEKKSEFMNIARQPESIEALRENLDQGVLVHLKSRRINIQQFYQDAEYH
ncbi:MAG: hypothetical protein AABX05_02230, partial [Nanoarchaeota archaeon]